VNKLEAVPKLHATHFGTSSLDKSVKYIIFTQEALSKLHAALFGKGSYVI
jgi:hypothetical protein